MPLVWRSKPAFDPETEAELAHYLRALAHPARVRLFRSILERRESLCGDLAGEVPLAQSTVSEHLRVLREAGLVECRVEGSRRFYGVSTDALDRLRKLLRGI